MTQGPTFWAWLREQSHLRCSRFPERRRERLFPLTGSTPHARGRFPSRGALAFSPHPSLPTLFGSPCVHVLGCVWQGTGSHCLHCEPRRGVCLQEALKLPLLYCHEQKH